MSDDFTPYSDELLRHATPRQEEIAREVNRAEGDYSLASLNLGVDRKTVINSVNRMKQRAHAAGVKESQSEAQESAEVADLRYRLEYERKKRKSAELAAEEMIKQVADYHASRFDIPKQKIAKFRGKGSHIRVAFGDTHGALIDTPAWGAFIADVEELNPKEVVHLGDIVDCDGFLASHHTTNYVAQTEYTYSDDIIAANLATDQLQAACPKSEIHYIEGNHDLRVETWAITAAQRQRADAEFLIQQLAPRYQLHLEKRGIHWWSRGEVHGDCVVGGTLELGNCFFTHPQTSSKHHAANMVGKYGHNVVYGHTHRRDYYPGVDVKGSEHAAWSPGCLCHLRKYWHHVEPFRHNHGYHVQLVASDGSFLGINVPIIGGKSYLMGLLKTGSGK